MAIATAWKAVTRKGLVGSSPTSSADQLNLGTSSEMENIADTERARPQLNYKIYRTGHLLRIQSLHLRRFFL